MDSRKANIWAPDLNEPLSRALAAETRAPSAVLTPTCQLVGSIYLSPNIWQPLEREPVGIGAGETFSIQGLVCREKKNNTHFPSGLIIN